MIILEILILLLIATVFLFISQIIFSPIVIIPVIYTLIKRTFNEKIFMQLLLVTSGFFTLASLLYNLISPLWENPIFYIWTYPLWIPVIVGLTYILGLLNKNISTRIFYLYFIIYSIAYFILFFINIYYPTLITPWAIQWGIFISLLLQLSLTLLLLVVVPKNIDEKNQLVKEIKNLFEYKIGFLIQTIEVVSKYDSTQLLSKQMNEINLEFHEIKSIIEHKIYQAKEKKKNLYIKIKLLETDVENFVKHDLKEAILEKIDLCISDLIKIKVENGAFELQDQITTLEQKLKNNKEQLYEVSFNYYSVKKDIDLFNSNIDLVNDLKQSIRLYRNTNSYLDNLENELKYTEVTIKLFNALKFNTNSISEQKMLLQKSLKEFKSYTLNSINTLVDKYKQIIIEIIDLREKISEIGIEADKKFNIKRQAKYFLIAIPKFCRTNSPSDGFILLVDSPEKKEIVVDSILLELQKDRNISIEPTDWDFFPMRKITFVGSRQGKGTLVLSSQHFNTHDKKMDFPVQIIPKPLDIITSSLWVSLIVVPITSLVLYLFYPIKNIPELSIMTTAIGAIIIVAVCVYRYYKEIIKFS